MQTVTTQKVLITKANGQKEFFDPSKLEKSLERAGASREVANTISENVVGEIKEGMNTSYIYKHAFSVLHKMERPTALRYSLRKAIMDLGPSGFAFEDFVAEIFKAHGYQVKTDQMVSGFCVEHEVDVVAWNDDKLIMSEAKFHNEQGMKSDLKVALYVKARIDDLKKASFVLDGKKRFLDEGWLITNTKFSETAVAYGKCQGLKMIGWNYPQDGNLQSLIETSNLHPITCLTSLSAFDKNNFLAEDVVLCKTLAENKNILKSAGFDDLKIKSILEEISML
jgi:hypothetical protein